MRTIVLFTALLLFTATAIAEDTASADGFVSLFNGSDLTGWDGDPHIWTVTDGVIIGETTPEKVIKNASYITSTATIPDNFHFKITFRMSGDGSNSGVQFRSKQLPNWDTYGYQADVDESGQWTGCLFHHKRGAVVKRGFVDAIDDDKERTSVPFGDPAELIKAYKKGDWNDYEILANGSVIVLKINGQLMCAVDDRHASEAAKSGIIALQIHPPKPMKIEFKNIKVKAL
ncbi:hypothetical protein FACS1894170_02650 [Planctomycetales bacterium]|nr:hypothetical protein FACS1894170_02650 [Planctomycetales bacterium]